MVGVHKILVRIEKRGKPGQVASSDLVLSGSVQFVKAFWQATSFQNLPTVVRIRWKCI